MQGKAGTGQASDRSSTSHFEQALDKDLTRIKKALEKFGSNVMETIEGDVIRDLSNYYVDTVTIEVDVGGLADLLSGLKGGITVTIKHVQKPGVTQSG